MKQVLKIVLVGSLLVLFFHGPLILSTSQQALTLWFEKLVPSMFVSLTILRVVYHQNMLAHVHIPFLPSLFNMNAQAFTFLLCISVVGFPNSAMFIDEAYAKKALTHAQAKRLLYTCSFAAPGFVIMTCGTLLFGSTSMGLRLFIANMASGWILLLFTRHTPIHMVCNTNIQPPSFMKALAQSILDSGATLFMIGGYMMLFMSATSVVVSYLPSFFAMPLQIIAECSSGSMYIQQLPFCVCAKEVITCMLLSFGGLCVHLQVKSMVTHISFSYMIYVFFRILQSILSALIFIVLLL